VSQKIIPDIIDCDLKKDYPILIVFGMNIPDTTGHQMTMFPPHPTSASALPGKIRTSKICVEVNKKSQ